MRLPSLVFLLTALAVCTATIPAQIGTTSAIPVTVALPGNAHDIAYDQTRNRFYVSVPDQNRIVVVDRADFSVITSVVIAPRPSGIDISHDGSTLFVALNQGSSVAYLDLDTLTVSETINIGTLLDHPSTWDVIEAKPGWIFVTANPDSSGFAYVVLIRRDLGNTASRVASNRIIRAGPRFHRDPLEQFLYVGEGFAPNSLYKLDISSPTAPIVLEDNHGSVSGTQRADVSADGSRILLSSGQILDTATFLQVGALIPGGVGRFNATATKAYVMTAPSTLTIYDTATQLSLGSQALSCSPASFFSQVTALYLDASESTALALVEDDLCGITTVLQPIATSLTPRRARFDAGPVPITITGNYFDLGSTPQVTVGGLAAANVVVVDANTLTCIVPSDGAGPKLVEVSNANGTAAIPAGFHRTPSMLVTPAPQPGSIVQFDVLVTPMDATGVYLSLGDPVAVPLPGIVGLLCLPDPFELVALPVWPFDGFTLAFPLPNLPALSGIRVLCQAFTCSNVPPVSALSNCAEFVVQ